MVSCAWLMSFNILLLSSFIHVVAYINLSFLLLTHS